jgi:HK97 family phage major capsid protein
MAEPGIRYAFLKLDLKSRQTSPASPRLIEGIISTPTPDHIGDILEPGGAKFALPMPLLWDHKEPIGQVLEASVFADGIRIKGQVATIPEPGLLQTEIDKRWHTIKNGLARGLSVGWKPLEAVRAKSGGLHVKAWKWLESSVVIVPMNEDATILSIKKYDARCAPIERPPSRVPPAVAGSPEIRSMAQPISEQIETLQAEIRTKSERLETLMSQEADGTLAEEDRGELPTLTKSIETDTERFQRLQTLERANAVQAKSVLEHIPAERRMFVPRQSAAPRVQVVNLEPGIRFARYALSVAAGKGSYSDTLAYARRWEYQTPELIAYIKEQFGQKAIPGTATGGSPSWGSELAEPQTLESEFVGLVRDKAILGRVQGFRKAPFNVRMVVQTGGSTINWVGEGAVKPVGELDFSEAELPHDKMAGIIVLTNELIRLSRPNAEQITRDDLVEKVAEFMDEQFFDPTITVSTARPASITNGIASPAASGTTGDDLRADFNTALATFDTTGSETVHIAMTQALARGISLLTNTLGQTEFPSMTPQGGSIMGYPVLVSNNVPSGTIVFFKANEIWLADDGRVALDASNQATLDMAGGASPTYSLWQRNLTAIRAEREVTWKVRRASGVVAVIDTAAYAPS